MHGAGIRVLLHPLRHLGEVRALFETPKSAADLSPAAVRRLVRKHRPRRAAAILARRYGLRVFDVLNVRAMHTHPEVRALLDLPPRRAASRPKDSTTRDLEAYALYALSKLGASRAELFAMTRRTVKKRVFLDSEPAEAKWLNRALAKGRALHRPSAKSPDAPVLAFLHRYLPTLPIEARRDSLKHYLRPTSAD